MHNHGTTQLLNHLIPTVNGTLLASLWFTTLGFTTLGLTTLGLTTLLSVQTAADEYTYYGGRVPAEEKNPDVENCEYQRLVVEQTCNKRINKSECIAEVHAACMAEFGPKAREDAVDAKDAKDAKDE